MKAIRHVGYHTFPELKDIEKPTPGPQEVLLKVAASGACHSDVAIFNEFDEGQQPLLDPEFTFGHEVAGWVEETGSEVTGFEKGAAYVVYGPIGCGVCPQCARGFDTYCTNKHKLGYLGVGLGRDGGMAEYLTVPARNLVPLSDADPVAASALADAGLTPYHAIKKALPHLGGAGKYALVIGAGGLGLSGVQILKALTGATIIVTDAKQEALDEAEKYGAITVKADDDQVKNIREITGGRGVDAAFDYVGMGPTTRAAIDSSAVGGTVVVVGLGNINSKIEWNFLTSPYEVDLTTTYWGGRHELHELVSLLRDGHLEPKYTTYSLDEGLEAYRKLMDGEVSGRAVIVPNESF